MKRMNRMITLAVAALGAASLLPAEQIERVAQVPFAFYLADEYMPAGEYRISSAEGSTFWMTRTSGGAGKNILALARYLKSRPQKGLTFECIRGSCRLATLWTHSGRTMFPAGKRWADRFREVAKIEAREIAFQSAD